MSMLALPDALTIQKEMELSTLAERSQTRQAEPFLSYATLSLRVANASYDATIIFKHSSFLSEIILISLWI